MKRTPFYNYGPPFCKKSHKIPPFISIFNIVPLFMTLSESVHPFITFTRIYPFLEYNCAPLKQTRPPFCNGTSQAVPLFIDFSL